MISMNVFTGYPTSKYVCFKHREYSIVLCNDDLPGMILDRVATAEYGPLPALWLKLQKFRPKSIDWDIYG